MVLFKSLFFSAVLIAGDFYVSHLRRKIVNKRTDENEDLERVEFEPLKDLQEKFKNIKFDFFNIDGVKWKGFLNIGFSYDNYWIDGAGYKISEKKFKEIVETTHKLHNMCLQATDEAIKDDEVLQNVFDIPQDMIPIIRNSWQNRQPDILARYDFLLGTEGDLYFLEVNGDTPSGIIEAGPAQKIWAEEFQLLQFNNLSNQITEGFKTVLQKNNKEKLIMFQNEDLEDSSTYSYLQSILQPFLKAQIESQKIEHVDEVIENELKKDNFEKSIIWRQYPFEWLASETTRNYFTDPNFYNINSQTLIEPPWKIVMSNKAISTLLYQIFPNNPHLIWSSLQPLEQDVFQISKQKYGREGEFIYDSSCYNYFRYFLIDSYYNYVHKPIFQEFIESELHKNRYITISCWVVQGKPCSILIREDLNPIIGTGSSVVPYYIQRNQNDDGPIEVSLVTNQKQFDLRQSLYGQEFFDSNNEHIRLNHQIIDQSDTFPNFKQPLIEQNLSSVEQKEKIMMTPEDKLTQEQLRTKINPILIGFSNEFQQLQPGTISNQINSNKDVQNSEKVNRGNSGGTWVSNPYTYTQINSNQPKYINNHLQRAGSTGKNFSSHS